MATIQLFHSKILVVSNEIAVHANCCCGCYYTHFYKKNYSTLYADFGGITNCPSYSFCNNVVNTKYACTRQDDASANEETWIYGGTDPGETKCTIKFTCQPDNWEHIYVQLDWTDSDSPYYTYNCFGSLSTEDLTGLPQDVSNVSTLGLCHPPGLRMGYNGDDCTVSIS